MRALKPAETLEQVSRESSFDLSGKLTASDCREDVGDGIEKEEFRRDRSLYQHNHAGSNDGQEADHVHDANAIEDDVAGTGERLGR